MTLIPVAIAVEDYKHRFSSGEYKDLKKEVKKGETVLMDVPHGDDIALVRGNDEFLELVQDEAGEEMLYFMAYFTGVEEGEELFYDNSKAELIIKQGGKTYSAEQWRGYIEKTFNESAMSKSKLESLVGEKRKSRLLTSLNLSKKNVSEASILAKNNDKFYKIFNEEGKVIFPNFDDEDFFHFTKFLDSMDIDYGETSVTGKDVVVYDVKKWTSSLKRIGKTRIRESRLPTMSQVINEAAEIAEAKQSWSKTIMDAYDVVKRSKYKQDISKLDKVIHPANSDNDIHKEKDEYFFFELGAGDDQTVTLWTDLKTGKLKFQIGIQNPDDINLRELKKLTEAKKRGSDKIEFAYQGTVFLLSIEEADDLKKEVFDKFKTYKEDIDIKSGDMIFKVHAGMGVEIYDTDVSNHIYIHNRDFKKLSKLLTKRIDESENGFIIDGNMLKSANSEYSMFSGDEVNENIIKDMNIKDTKEFGKKFKAAIKDVVKDVGGKYVGYFFSISEDAVAIVTTKTVSWFVYNTESQELEAYRETMVHESSNTYVIMLAKPLETDQEIHDVIQLLIDSGIQAASGAGNSSSHILVDDRNKDKAIKLLKKAGYQIA